MVVVVTAKMSIIEGFKNYSMGNIISYYYTMQVQNTQYK